MQHSGKFPRAPPPRSPPIVMPFVLNRERASILRVIQPTCYVSHVYACAANPAHFNRDSHEIAAQERMHNHRGYIYLSSNTRVRNDTDYSAQKRIRVVNRFLNWRSFAWGRGRRRTVIIVFSNNQRRRRTKFSNCHVQSNEIESVKSHATRHCGIEHGGERSTTSVPVWHLIRRSIQHNKFAH